MRVAILGPLLWSLRAQTPGLMRLHFPVTAVCLFGYRPQITGNSNIGKVTLFGTQVGTQIGGSHDGTTGLLLWNQPTAVSGWFSGSVGDLRRKGSTSGSPDKRPGLLLRVAIRPNSFNLRLQPPGFDMDCRYVLGFPFWESNWRNYCSGSSVIRPGRNWAPGSTTGPIIHAISDG